MFFHWNFDDSKYNGKNEAKKENRSHVETDRQHEAHMQISINTREKLDHQNRFLFAFFEQKFTVRLK